jgi:3-oxoacyl-[acyl-carrier protein] reductase
MQLNPMSLEDRAVIVTGAVETPMTEIVRGAKFIERTMASIPMGRIAQIDEVVGLCGFLLSGSASYISGQHLNIDGGSRIGFCRTAPA